MTLLELVLQGVKGYPTQARIALGPGHVVLHAPATAQLRPILEALLFFDGRPKEEEARLEAPGAAAVRAGLSFQAKDGFTYRLVRDLRGGCALHRLDQAAGKFVPFTQDPLEIGQYLRTQVGLPPRALFSEIFTLGTERLPTLRDVAAETASQDPKPLSRFAPPGGGEKGKPQQQHGLRPADVKFRGFQGPEDAVETPALSEAQVRERLELCKAELETSRSVEKLQFQLDGLNTKLYKNEERLQDLEKVDGEIKNLVKQLGQFKALDALPADFPEKLKAFEHAGQRKAESQAKIDTEREELEERAARANPIPVTTDPRFWAGAGGGLLLLAAAIFTDWKLLALLDIPAFGFAAFVGIKYVSELQARDGLARKRGLLDEREKKIEEQFKADSGLIRDTMKALEVERPTELTDRLAARETARARVAAAQQHAEQLRADPALQAAITEQAELKAEAGKLEEQLSVHTGGFVRAAGDIEAELKRLEAQLASGGGGRGPGLRAESSGSFARGPDGPSGPDLSIRLVEKAADLFQLEIAELAPAISPRIAQYLSALADRRYSGVELSAAGSLICQAPGRKVAFPDLPGRDQDLAWFALQLTLLERYSTRFKLPVIFDDPFAFLDGPHQELAAKMVKYLGSLTQVLHRTTLPAMSTAADQVVEVQ